MTRKIGGIIVYPLSRRERIIVDTLLRVVTLAGLYILVSFLAGCSSDKLVFFEYSKAADSIPAASKSPEMPLEISHGDMPLAVQPPVTVLQPPAVEPKPDPWYTDPATLAMIVISLAAGIREARKQWQRIAPMLQLSAAKNRERGWHQAIDALGIRSPSPSETGYQQAADALAKMHEETK